MPMVKCKYCGGMVSGESGTVYCPSCQKAFWVAPASAPQSKTGTVVQLRKERSGSRNGMNFILAISGIAMFAAGGFILLAREPAEEDKSAQIQEVEKEIAGLEAELELEKMNLSKVEASLATERKLAETARWRNNQQTLATDKAVAKSNAPNPSTPVSKPASMSPLIEQCEKSVVVIGVANGSGSGFLISEDGYVATNAHVVGSAKTAEIQIQRSDSRDLILIRGAKVVAVHADHDLALIKLPEAPATVSGDGKYPAVKIRGEKLVAGEEVFAVGSPGAGFLTLTFTVSRGTISNPLRWFGITPVVQTTAIVNPGNSGGPLFDMKGLVAGVVTAKAIGAEAVTFAVPAGVLSEFLNRHRITLKK
jgi:S1-C subfamily serine protease